MAGFLRNSLPRYKVSFTTLERIFALAVALSRVPDGLHPSQVSSLLVLTVRDVLSEELVKREGTDSPSLPAMLQASLLYTVPTQSLTKTGYPGLGRVLQPRSRSVIGSVG